MTTNFNIVRNGSIALIAFVLLALPFSAVRAADLGYDSYDTYDYSTPSYDTYDYSTPSYDTYGYGGSSGYLGGSGYVGSGYIMGSGYLGSSYLPSRPSYIPTSAGNTNVNTNTNTNILNNGNSCTASNSCNTNIVTTNPAPVINNVISNPPSYTPPPVCNTCGCAGYAACYHPPVVYQNPPIAYNAAPYISLSQAPYTGLDLGFWGTIAYWSFLILWCLVAAYLIVVKKVQNRVLRSLNTFLFGDYSDSAAASHEAVVAPVQAYSAPAPVHQVDAIDPFIISQINRVRA